MKYVVSHYLCTEEMMILLYQTVLTKPINMHLLHKNSATHETLFNIKPKILEKNSLYLKGTCLKFFSILDEMCVKIRYSISPAV